MYLSARAWRELQRRMTDDAAITLNVISLAVFSRANGNTSINRRNLNGNINIFIVI